MTLFRNAVGLLRTWLTWGWSFIRGAAAPAVAHSAEEVTSGLSSVLIALPPSLPATAPPSLGGTDENLHAEVAAHLEFYGYAIRHEPDGWSYVQHPDRRYNFHVRVFPRAMKLDCRVGIGASIGSSRLAWLDFVNGANGRGSITRFALDEDESGTYVRMRATVPGPYNR
jgi:hypothetical protein